MKSATAIVFLNNENNDFEAVDEFSVGELILYNVFPKNSKMGFPIKASAGKLVVFPANLPHEVTETTHGNRFALVV